MFYYAKLKQSLTTTASDFLGLPEPQRTYRLAPTRSVSVYDASPSSLRKTVLLANTLATSGEARWDNADRIDAVPMPILRISGHAVSPLEAFPAAEYVVLGRGDLEDNGHVERYVGADTAKAVKRVFDLMLRDDVASALGVAMEENATDVPGMAGPAHRRINIPVGGAENLLLTDSVRGMFGLHLHAWCELCSRILRLLQGYGRQPTSRTSETSTWRSFSPSLLGNPLATQTYSFRRTASASFHGRWRTCCPAPARRGGHLCSEGRRSYIPRRAEETRPVDARSA